MRSVQTPNYKNMQFRPLLIIRYTLYYCLYNVYFLKADNFDGWEYIFQICAPFRHVRCSGGQLYHRYKMVLKYFLLTNYEKKFCRWGSINLISLYYCCSKSQVRKNFTNYFEHLEIYRWRTIYKWKTIYRWTTNYF